MFSRLAMFVMAVGLSGSAVRGEIQFKLEFDRTVPDTLGYTSNYILRDADRDGVRDLFFKGTGQISAYSLVRDSVLLYFIPTSDAYSRAYAEGFVDVDSSLDIVEVVAIPRGDHQDIVQLVHYNGFSSADDTILISTVNTTRKLYLKSVFAVDRNGDSISELYGRAYYVDTNMMYPYDPIYTTYARDFVYDYTTQTTTNLGHEPRHGYESYPLFNGSDPVDFTTWETYRSQDMPGAYIYSWRTIGIQFYQNDILVFGFAYGANGCAASYWDTYTSYASLLGYLVGDFVSGSPGWEMLAGIHLYDTGVLPGGDDECVSWSNKLICYGLETPLHATVLWNQDVPDGFAANTVFSDPRYPDRLFYGRDKVFYMVNAAEDLTVIDSSGRVEGLGWYTGYKQPADDGPFYAVYRDANRYRLLSMSVGDPTDVDEGDPAVLPAAFDLGRPYPNPFNPTVSIPVSMPSRGHLKVEVFNSLGQRVDVVCDREMPAGEMTLDWDGSRCASGVYLFKATAWGESRTVKAMLLK